MNPNIIALFNGCFLDIQRRVPVIIETMNEGSVLACRNRADHEAHGQKPGNHERLSPSTIKYGPKIMLSYFIRFVTYSQREVERQEESESPPPSSANMPP